ncbi:HEXXH motif-containing putative peptide modification protein [Streptomyces sp. TP-A0356]|uniref:aKG-HExxH-type peptide beta-hydroxylase n=1 Tax=Streptomyces sp. TP-A0356 TaxID=1359208 RepID=UPI000B1A3A38|nr:HEXXH motif-containing putative peptide modification protein [Streptomyces sp. TP-A0356]
MTQEPPLALSALTLPRGLWQQIARGAPDPGTVRLLRAARAGRNLLLLRALHHGRHDGAGWDAAIALLATVRHHSPAVFDALITDPTTGTVLAEAVRGRRHHVVTVLAAVAGHRADIPFRLDVPVPGGTLVLPGLGRVTLDPGASTACVERGPDGTRVTRQGSRTVVPVPDTPGDAVPGWEPVHRLRLTAHGAPLALRLDSNGVPGPGGPRLLGPAELARWRDRLGAAWERLADRHPERADTVRGTVRAVVPLDPVPSGLGSRGLRLSASFSDAIGLVALAPLDDPAELAAVLVHETQHSLLYALQDLTRLLDARPGARGHAPWSGRLRPPSALLQGAAAFLVTAGFWRTEAAFGNPLAPAAYERWRHTARRAGDELVRGGWLTADGHLLLTAMREVLEDWERRPA